MKVSAGGRSFEVVEATSPIPGRRAVVFKEEGGQAWPDLFLWDPMSETIHYDGEQLRSFIVRATRGRNIGATATLAITDAVSAVGRGANRVASGGYSGMFGFGEMGSHIASMGAVFNLVVKVVAFVVTLPFRLTGGALRMVLARSWAAEEAKLVQAMPGVFAALANRAQ